MNKSFFKLLLFITPSPVKSYYAIKIAHLESRITHYDSIINEFQTGEGFKIFARDQRELLALTSRQMAMRRVRQHSSIQTQPRFRMPFVARLFRTVSKWLARWAKSLDHSAGAGKEIKENGRPQLKLELEK